MPNKNKILNYLFLAFIIILILTISLSFIYYYQQIEKAIETAVRTFGYLAVFIFASLLDALPQPFGSDVPLALGILFGLNPILTLAITIIGMIVASIINYLLGAGYSEVSMPHICSNKKYAKYCNLFQKYGKWSVLIAAISPLPYEPFGWLSGAFRMKRNDYILFAIIPRSIRLTVVALIAYFLPNILKALL